MIKRQRLFAEATRTGGLATEANALRRFKPVADTIDELHMDYFVLVHNGRFFPVVRLRDGQTHLMHYFMDNKIGVM